MPTLDPIHVLLVEDDEDDYLLTKSFLNHVSDCDYQLDWARSYVEALRFVDETVVDVVLLDYRLGRLDGVTFAEDLRKRGYPAPIIMLTGQPSLDIDLETLRAGTVDYLSKHEITANQLERSIRYAIQQARSVSAVKESRRFLRNVIDALPQHIAVLDSSGVIVAVNENWREFARANALDHIAFGVGANYVEICERTEGPDAFDAMRVADAIRRTIDGEDLDFIVEYPCHADDEERWFSVNITRVPTADAPHIIVSHENITRRIIAERELSSMATTMETLMASSPAAIIAVDEEVRITHWSPAAEKIFGWTKDEVLGEINPIFPESQREDMLAYHRRILDGEIVIGREARRLAKDGTMVPVHVSVAPITAMDGKHRGALGIFLDLSSRLEIEDELRRSEQQYRALVEHLPDVVTRYDRDLRRVYGNAAANAFLGDSGLIESGASLQEIGLPESDLESWTDRFKDVVATGEPRDFEWTVNFSGPGYGGIYESRVVPEIARDGTVESLLVVSRDITARKRRDEERRFLNDASSRLASTLDFDTTLKTIMELLVPRFADIASISLFDQGGVPIKRVAMVQAPIQGLAELHPNFKKYEIEPTGDYGIQRVYQTGESAVYEYVDSEEAITATSPALLREAVLSLGQRSAMFVPLKVRGKVIGAIGLAYSRSGRRYTDEDLPFAEDLAARAAIAVDNARLHQHLERSEERHRTLVEQIPAVVFMTSVDDLSQPIYLSPQVETMTGYSVAQLTQGEFNWYRIVHPEDLDRVSSADASSRASGGERTLEYRLITRDGRTIWIRDEARLIYDEFGEPRNWQGILSDVTLQKELESQLTHQAFHDTLTGLPNRALFNERVRHAQERRTRYGSNVAVCFMDLDNFKVINDSLGHSVGDQLLIQVAGRLQRYLRAEDTAARFGGDEFALLLEGISNPSNAMRVVSRIAGAFDDPFNIQGRELFVTVSIGVSIATPDDIQHRDLLREADAAMYKAKRGGKARYELYSPALTTDAVNRLDLESDLRRTLNGEQMELHYQPVVDLPTGRTLGAEALVRWNHPEHGMISPDRFIPIAEETAMIVDLGRWILEESCTQVHAWNERLNGAPPLHLSVNLSARQFSDEMLVDDVRSILERTGLDPALLCLEITETVMTEDEEAAAQMLSRLKALGVRLAVDDFGIGYSSLSSLRRFPVDLLKIDRSFVDGLIDDPNDSVIVSGVIGLAHALDLEVIAEGVEGDEQRDQLVELGCDFAQGYLFARPLDITTFASLHVGTIQQRAGLSGTKDRSVHVVPESPAGIAGP